MEEKEYEQKIEELKALLEDVKLLEDPLANIDDFNSKLAILQGKRERATVVLSDALKNKADSEKAYKSAKFNYEVQAYKLLSTDATIKSLKSADLRDAQIKSTLPVEWEAVSTAEGALIIAEAFHKRVWSFIKDFDVKNESLIQQINVVRMELHIDPSLRPELKVNK